MYMFRELEGSTLEGMLMPPFRVIHFEKDPAVVRVSTLLRAAWVAEPNPEGLTTWMLSHANQSGNEDQGTANCADPSTLHTPWRDEIYYNWNHVFYDAFDFLQEAACGIGGFHPPSHDILPLLYQEEDTVEKVWETSVLLIPAYLAPGVKVRMLGAEKDGEGKRKEFGTFDGQNKTEVWFLTKGHKVLFQVEEGIGGAREGPAAVFAVGIGCTGNCSEEEVETKT